MQSGVRGLKYAECAFCNHSPCEGEVKLRSSMTAYHYSEEDRESGKPDPNAPFVACDGHYEDYRLFWQLQWDEYWSSVL